MFDVTDLPPAPWAKKPKPAKAEAKPALTRQAIVDSAMRIIDTEGLDAVSMRRIAQDLGTGAASLYAHVADKEELLDLVVDQIMGEMTLPEGTQALMAAAQAQASRGTGAAAGEASGGGDANEAGNAGAGAGMGAGVRADMGTGAGDSDGPDGDRATAVDWREELKEMARTCLKVLIAHGDVARTFVGRIPFGPNGLVVVEAQLALLRAAGLPDYLAAFTGDLLGQFVTGYAVDEVSWRGRFPNNTEEEMVEHLSQLHDYLEALPVARFPNMVAMAGKLLTGENEGFSRFELGLEVLIRGLASFIPQTTSGAQWQPGMGATASSTTPAPGREPQPQPEA